MISESDITIAIQQSEYVKAKLLFVEFLKQILTLLVHQNPNIEINHLSFASSAIFYILSHQRPNKYFELLEKCTLDSNFPVLLFENIETLLLLKNDLPGYIQKIDSTEEWKIILKLTKCVKQFEESLFKLLKTNSMEEENLTKFNNKMSHFHHSFNQYKNILRFLSETIFKYLDCKKLAFKNELHLEAFLDEENDVVDYLIECKFGEKTKILLELWKDLNTLALGKQSPLGTVQMIVNLVQITHSSSFIEFEKEIVNLVNYFGLQVFSWENLKQFLRRTSADIEEAGETLQDIEGLQLLPGIKRSKLTAEYEKEIVGDGKCAFGQTVLQVLGKEPSEESLALMTDAQMHGKVNSFLDEYFETRLNKSVGTKFNVTEHHLNKLFESSTLYENFFTVITKLLNSSDVDEIVSKIRSMLTLLTEVGEAFNTYDENTIISEIGEFKRIKSVFQPIKESIETYIVNVEHALTITETSSTGELVSGLKTLCEAFFSFNKNETCSLKSINNFLVEIHKKSNKSKNMENKNEELNEEIKKLKNQLVPFLHLKNTFSVTLHEITDFLESLIKLKPSEVKYANFFENCIQNLQNFDNIKLENEKLNKTKLELNKDITILESEVLAANDYKLKLNYCEQKHTELTAQFRELEEEYVSLKASYSDLQEEKDNFLQVLDFSTQYNIEKNNHIEFLESEIQRLKNS